MSGITYQDMKAYREAIAYVEELTFKLFLLSDPNFIMMPTGRLLGWKLPAEEEKEQKKPRRTSAHTGYSY